METALHTSGCSRFSVEKALELAARSGYRQVEIAAEELTIIAGHGVA